jgi:hypothetical protein
VIQDVEEIASELQRNPFSKAELAAQGDIPLRGTETAEGISRDCLARWPVQAW